MRLFPLLLCPLLAYGALHGTVTDASTGAPIPQVEIIVISAPGVVAGKAMSDENGRYRIDITAQGQFYAGTLKRGYKEVRLMHTGAIMGLPVSLRADDVFDLRLVKFCSISGHVVDESGKPFQFAHMVTPRLGGRGHEIVGNPFFFR